MECRSVRFQKFDLGSGFFGTEKRLVRFRLFSKKDEQYKCMNSFMYVSSIFTRLIYAFVSLYKSLNILKEQLEFIYQHEIFLFKKITIAITTKISTIWALSTVHIVQKEHNLVIFQTLQPAIRCAFGGH
jgi:hypothetical protein